MRHDLAHAIGATREPVGRVWILDDTRLEADLAERTLRGDEVRIELFHDGADLLETLAQGGPPDVLLLDWNMPGLTGIEVLRYLRISHDDVRLPVLVLTVEGHRDDVVAALEAGANDYVTKPYEGVELRARVLGLLRAKRLHERLVRAEREIADARLQVQRASYQALLATIPDVVARFDRDLRVSYVNPAVLAAIGREPREVVGRTVGELALAPEIVARSETVMREVLETGRELSLEDVLETPSGPRLFETRVVPERDDAGVVTSIVSVTRDVTESRRVADQASRLEGERRARAAAERLADQLRESEARRRLATEASGVGLWEHDPATGRLEWDARGAEILGARPATLPDLLARVHPDDRRAAAEGLARVLDPSALSPSREYRAEHRVVREDGTIVWIEARGQAFFDDAGRPTRVVGVVLDATERKDTERERARLLSLARAGEEQFRQLADTMPQIVWSARADGHRDYYNRRWYELVGHASGDPGQESWLEALHPGDRERVVAQWQEALRSGHQYEVELRLRHHDGTYRWYLSRALPMRDAEGALVRWFGTSTDIDAQKRNEATLAVLADASKVLVGSLDLGATLREVTRVVVPRFADACIIELAEGGGQRLAALAHALAEKEDLLRACAERGGIVAGDAPPGSPAARHPGGAQLLSEIDDRLRAAPARDDEHAAMLRALDARSAVSVPLAIEARSLGSLTLAITEQPRRYDDWDLAIAEELGRRVATGIHIARLFELSEQERRRAEEANRAKDEFLSVASHELRTPLNAILGWARLLASASLRPEQQARAIETIARNARVQAQLVDDILDVSRIITGKLRLELQRIEPRTVVEAATEVLAAAAGAKQIELSVREEGPPRSVLADPTRLQQVAWNLVANAIKFSPPGGRVEVVLRHGDDALEIVVADQGVGIEPAFLPHVFAPFRQADASTTRAYGGLGLGLSIVKHIVELHGGTVEVASEGRDRGARFTARLPWSRRAPGAGPSPSSQLPAVPEEVPPAASAGGSLRGISVLIVEDDPDSRDLLEALLRQRGATVRATGSADEALASLRESVPDVLVTDIGMPETDGYALLRAIRARPAAEGGVVPAIALTAYAGDADRDRAYDAGFAAHVAKPADPAEIAYVVASVVRRA